MIKLFTKTKVKTCDREALAILLPSGQIAWEWPLVESVGEALDLLHRQCPNLTFQQMEEFGYRIITVQTKVREA